MACVCSSCAGGYCAPLCCVWYHTNESNDRHADCVVCCSPCVCFAESLDCCMCPLLCVHQEREWTHHCCLTNHTLDVGMSHSPYEMICRLACCCSMSSYGIVQPGGNVRDYATCTCFPWCRTNGSESELFGTFDVGGRPPVSWWRRTLRLVIFLCTAPLCDVGDEQEDEQEEIWRVEEGGCVACDASVVMPPPQEQEGRVVEDTTYRSRLRWLPLPRPAAVLLCDDHNRVVEGEAYCWKCIANRQGEDPDGKIVRPVWCSSCYSTDRVMVRHEPCGCTPFCRECYGRLSYIYSDKTCRVCRAVIVRNIISRPHYIPIQENLNG